MCFVGFLIGLGIRRKQRRMANGEEMEPLSLGMGLAEGMPCSRSLVPAGAPRGELNPGSSRECGFRVLLAENKMGEGNNKNTKATVE